jgi:hypothetical protein
MYSLAGVFAKDICGRCALDTVSHVVHTILDLQPVGIIFEAHFLPGAVPPHHNLTGEHKKLLRLWVDKHSAIHNGDLLGVLQRYLEIYGVPQDNQTTLFLTQVFDGGLFNHITESAHAKFVVSLLLGGPTFRSWQDVCDEKYLINQASERLDRKLNTGIRCTSRRAAAERCLEAVPGEIFPGSGPLFPLSHPDRESVIDAVLWETFDSTQ